MMRLRIALFCGLGLLLLGGAGCDSRPKRDPAAVAKRAAWVSPEAISALASAIPGDDAVLGVVFDEPVSGEFSSLGVFADGSLKLLSSIGTGLVAGSDKLSASTQELIRGLCADASRLRPAFDGDAAREWPLPRTLRVTVLTKRGVLSAEEAQSAMQDGTSPLAVLTPKYLELLKAASILHRAGVR